MLKPVRAVGVAGLVVLATVPLGCGGTAEIPPDRAAEIPVGNPSPDNKLKDVTLKNEYQFKDKIGEIPPAQ